jgi:2-dehydro-3-deoxygluconokinase
MTRILTFGEIMLRISPLNRSESVFQSETFRIEPGGSEANVAIALANLNEDVAFLTTLPDNILSEKIFRYLRGYNVDTTFIKKSKGRVGLYFTENGIGPRPSFVHYDRKHSTFSQARSSDYDIKSINEGFSWFHTSGITPAVSKRSSETVEEIISMLKNDMNISIDLNYREKLWNWAPEPRAETIKSFMMKLCSDSSLLIGNENDFSDMFGFETTAGVIDRNEYSEIAKKMFKKMPRLQYLALSLRDSISASENRWSGLLFSKEGSFNSQVFDINNIVDRVGTGDSFAAGVLYGLINKKTPQDTIDFAVALSALNHTVRGDASQFRKDDVEHILKAGQSGRIIR